MLLTDKIKKSIDECVLCWLATSNSENQPNVSPKEVFSYYDEFVLIANIASPQSLKNIKENPRVCLSFVNVFKEIGFQLKGVAEIVTIKNPNFNLYKKSLEILTQGKFPFQSIFKIQLTSVKPIIAPSYRLYPEISEEEHIALSKKNYLSR